MKAKQLFLSAALLLGGVGICLPSFQSADSFEQRVLKASPWSDFESGDPAFGSSYSVPTMTYTLDGHEYPATVIVTFPDGSQTTDTNIRLTQAGVHTFEYTVNVNGVWHAITEKVNVGFPQMYVGDADKSSIEYVSKEKSKELGAAGSAGLYVKLGLGDTLNFTKPIYLDEMTDANTLLRGYIAPTNKGAVDFNQLYMKLTDADDPNKFVIVCYYSHVETGSNGVTSHSSSVLARSDAQPYFAGWHQTQGLHTNDTWGLWSGVSFDGYMLDKQNYPDYVDTAMFCFGFDHESKTAYGTGFGRGQTLETILDLDDVPTQVSTPWSGFASNRAFLSVYAESYSGTSANFVITDIGGVSAEELMKNSYTDKDAPEISIESEYETLPNGVVGYNYPIPTAKAYDQVSMECPVKTEVFYNYFSDDRSTVKMTDGTFHMDKQGTYTIRYTASDKAGNTSEKLYTISAFNSLDPIEFDLPSASNSLAVGSYVAVDRNLDIKGGVGGKSVKIYSEVDGVRTLIEGDGFRLMELKDTKVVYEVTDMIGQTKEKSYTISVFDGKKPILEKSIVYPRYFISGGYYELPPEKVYLYEDGKLAEKALTLEVTDSTGTKQITDGEFSPVVTNNEDKVVVKAKYGDLLLQENEVICIKNMGTAQSARAINLSNYFVSKGLSKELTSDDGMLLTTTGSEASFEFATPFLHESFNLDMKALLGFASGSGVTMSLIDAGNPSNEISASLKLIGETTYLEVNGSRVAFVNNDINVGNNDYSVSFADGSFNVGTATLPVKYLTNGDAFEGFESDKAYFRLTFDSVPLGAKLNFMTFCGTGFSSKTARDRVSPVVLMNDDYGGTRTIGSVYHIDACKAFDVLSPNVTFTLDVTSPSGKAMTALDGTLLSKADPSKGYDIKLEEYGQYYFSLTAIEDSRFLANGNETTIGYSIRVYDDIAPVVSFQTGMQKEATVGETILLPKFSATDNITSADKLIIQRILLTPSGDYRYLDDSYDSFVAKEEGVYKLIIHVIDEAGNTVSKTFETKVRNA